MPLEFYPHKSNEIFKGDSSVIIDEDKLVEFVSRTLMAQYTHVKEIISTERSDQEHRRFPIAKKDVANSVIKKVLHTKSKFHRDGLLFQHISWISMVMRKNQNDLFKAPHCRPADKGQDCIIVHISSSSGKISGISVCEDKATIHCRNVITNQVFPEFNEYDSGDRDAELESEVLAILKQNPSIGDANEIIEKIFWSNIRRYRINITVKNEEPSKLFKGYDDCIKGGLNRRTADTTVIQNMREWFDSFSRKLESYILSLIED
ncbi:MAG: hypothetical protein FVQ80_15990 [Planctomycetes bacterium]|nr:hypothetical protein [Planctomycetota bacterium]